MKDDQKTLERSGVKKPDLNKIKNEINEAQADFATYSSRMNQARAWWMNEWHGQTADGRSWETYTGVKSFPWDGCSDSRLRIVDTIVKEHVTLCLAAGTTAKRQVKSIRPFISGKEVQIAQRMMDWRMEMMSRELLTTLPQILNWRFGGGLAFTKIEWEQQRELIYLPITIEEIGQLGAQLGMGDLADMILDPDKFYDDQLIPQLQQLSPVLPTAEARTILNDLRAGGTAEIPLASMRVNKPKWSFKRPIQDLIFPSETCDIQQARFTCERELISETELVDRIVTDGYEDDFVEEALKHKGNFASWWNYNPTAHSGSDKDLFELNHFLSWRISHNGTPCLYRTVFMDALCGDELYAVHRKFEYEHGQFPFVAHRRSYHGKPLLSSIGIAEEAYTDELDIKRQQDGLNDRTQIIHQPPMITPPSRAKAISASYGPNSVMTAMRPEAVVFPPLPPMDQTPVIVMQMVQDRLDRRYAIIGGNVDPEIKALRRQQIVQEVLGELDLAQDQTLWLMQQFESDEDIAKVAGGEPWEYSLKDIQGQYTISSAVDINLIDMERAAMKLDNFAKILPFRQSGGMVFNAMAQILDPDLADALEADQASPVAMEKEVDDEYTAVGQILSGIEARKPTQAMNEIRLQTIQQIMSDPMTMQRVQQDPVAQKRLENRVKHFEAQIQQFQQNPQIGRSLSTKTFSNDAPVMQAPTNG